MDEGEIVTPVIFSLYLVQNLNPEELLDYLVTKFNFKVEDISCFQGSFITVYIIDVLSL